MKPDTLKILYSSLLKIFNSYIYEFNTYFKEYLNEFDLINDLEKLNQAGILNSKSLGILNSKSTVVPNSQLINVTNSKSSLILNSQSTNILNSKFTPTLNSKSLKQLLKNSVITAPLAGISDNTFRIFAKAFGSYLNFTEMISSYGVYYNNKETLKLSFISDFERPCGIQIFGFQPEILAEAAKILEESADLIDINMGCPVPKVLKAKSGGYLLTDENQIEKILKKVKNTINKPLSIKIRLGWDYNNINALKVCQIAQDCGVGLVTIHGRTVKQGFIGDVNYEKIKEVKSKVKIPVIISGDIDSPQKALNVLNYTECDGVMIGRAARGRLWIFHDILFFINLFLKSLKDNLNLGLELDSNLGFNLSSFKSFKSFNFEPSLDFKKEFAVLYLKFLVFFLGEEKAVKEFRKHFAWIFKWIKNASKLRQEFNTIAKLSDAVGVIESINSG